MTDPIATTASLAEMQQFLATWWKHGPVRLSALPTDCWKLVSKNKESQDTDIEHLMVFRYQKQFRLRSIPCMRGAFNVSTRNIRQCKGRMITVVYQPNGNPVRDFDWVAMDHDSLIFDSIQNKTSYTFPFTYGATLEEAFGNFVRFDQGDLSVAHFNPVTGKEAAASSLPNAIVSSDNLAHDMLRGAEAIAEFIFGDPKQRRKIYHMVETQSLPSFRLGGILCARKSTLMKWIEEQEKQS